MLHGAVGQEIKCWWCILRKGALFPKVLEMSRFQFYTDPVFRAGSDSHEAKVHRKCSVS